MACGYNPAMGSVGPHRDQQMNITTGATNTVKLPLASCQWILPGVHKVPTHQMSTLRPTTSQTSPAEAGLVHKELLKSMAMEGVGGCGGAVTFSGGGEEGGVLPD